MTNTKAPKPTSRIRKAVAVVALTTAAFLPATVVTAGPASAGATCSCRTCC